MIYIPMEVGIDDEGILEQIERVKKAQERFDEELCRLRHLLVKTRMRKQDAARLDGEELDRLGVYLEYYKKARKEGNGTDGSDDEGEG